MIKEMLKLRELLDQEEINWCDRSDEVISRTHFEYKGYKWSIINGLGTYGGYYFDEKDNKNLLELMSAAVNENEPIGFLTADECIEIIKKCES